MVASQEIEEVRSVARVAKQEAKKASDELWKAQEALKKAKVKVQEAKSEQSPVPGVESRSRAGGNVEEEGGAMAMYKAYARDAESHGRSHDVHHEDDIGEAELRAAQMEVEQALLTVKESTAKVKQAEAKAKRVEVAKASILSLFWPF